MEGKYWADKCVHFKNLGKQELVKIWAHFVNCLVKKVLIFVSKIRNKSLLLRKTVAKKLSVSIILQKLVGHKSSFTIGQVRRQYENNGDYELLIWGKMDPRCFTPCKNFKG